MKMCPRCGNKIFWHLSINKERCSNCGLTRKFNKTVWQRTRIST